MTDMGRELWSRCDKSGEAYIDPRFDEALHCPKCAETFSLIIRNENKIADISTPLKVLGATCPKCGEMIATMIMTKEAQLDAILDELSRLCDEDGIRNESLRLWAAGKLIGGPSLTIGTSTPFLCAVLAKYRQSKMADDLILPTDEQLERAVQILQQAYEPFGWMPVGDRQAKVEAQKFLLFLLNKDKILGTSTEPEYRHIEMGYEINENGVGNIVSRDHEGNLLREVPAPTAEHLERSAREDVCHESSMTKKCDDEGMAHAIANIRATELDCSDLSRNQG